MRLFFVVACVAAAGCNNGPLGPDLQIKVANKLDGNAACPDVDAALSGLGAAKLRITIRVHKTGQMADSGPVPDALCDSVVDMLTPDKATLEFKLPDMDRADVFVEAFDASTPPQRIATGTLFDVNPKENVPLLLRLFHTESFRCLPQAKLNTPRAFHTATTLPNGEILIAGGLVPLLAPGSTGPTSKGLESFIKGDLEIFDPRTGQFIALTPPSGPISRAFHTAALLPTNPGEPYKVLLIGGVTPGDQTKLSSRDYNFDSGDVFRMILTGVKSATPSEVITYDPGIGRTTTVAPSNALHSEAFQAGTALATGGAVVAGGVKYMGGAPNGPSAFVDVTLDGTAVKAVSMNAMSDLRFAGALVQLSDSAALLVGGVPAINVMMPLTQSLPFDHVTNLMGTPSVTPVLGQGTPFPVLQFATATRLDAGSVLVSGGLEVTPGIVVNPAPNSVAVNPPPDNGGLYKLSVSGVNPVAVAPVAPDGTYKFDSSCTTPMRYRPVAWNAATLVPTRDRVLITGGTARNVVGVCSDCDGGDDALACALGQTSIYNVTTNKIGPAPEPMQVPRYGHTQSILPDGKVILIGGYTRNSKKTFAVAVPEVWNPARKVAPMDDQDDPVAAELAALKMKREPGGAAHCSDKSAAEPAVACSKPGIIVMPTVCN